MLNLTSKQGRLTHLIKTKKNVLAYGGARSGKTFGTIVSMIYIAIKHPGSRQLVARRYAVDIRGSIFLDTIPKVLTILGLKRGEHWTANSTFMEFAFKNGSLIQCAGLDDKERVDKILGQEFATIYVNESHDVDYQTVEKLQTRLSQNFGGVNRFICDLNPTTKAHWTHKLFIEGVNPKTGEPLAKPDDYAWIQMNPQDNAENLPADYIETKLETLRGQERARFLLGDYSSTDDLLVFRPGAVCEWEALVEWIGTGADVKLVAGLDLGYNDADAFAVLAYRDGQPGAWLIYDHKGRRQTVSDLAGEIRRGLDWIGKNLNLRSLHCPIYTDTGGGGKKSAYELEQTFNLDIKPALKRDKKLGLDFLQEWVNSGELRILKHSTFVDECDKIVWTRGDNGEIVREIDDSQYHPDMMDAILYAVRQLMNYGNSVYRRPEPEELVEYVDPKDAPIVQYMESILKREDQYF